MPEFLTQFLVRTSKADGSKALEIRGGRVSGLILRVEPTGSKRYLTDYYVKEVDLQAGKLKHRRTSIGGSWKPDTHGKETPGHQAGAGQDQGEGTAGGRRRRRGPRGEAAARAPGQGFGRRFQ